MNSIDESLMESRSMMEKGEFLATLERVRAARQEASYLHKELQDAVVRYRRNAKT